MTMAASAAPVDPADHPGHAGDGERGRVDRQLREELVQDQPVDPSQRGTQVQGGGEHAARGARAKRQRGRQQLEGEQDQQEPGHLPRQHVLHGGIPDPLDVVVPGGQEQGVHDDAHREHAEHVAEVVVAADSLVEKVLEGVDGADINHGDETHEHAQADVEDEDEGVGVVEVGRLGAWE